MLFDLRGRRRRAVQVTYLMLALLMGGGLVLFGIGGDVSGGLIDAFKGGGGGSSADSALQDRADRQEERLARNPQNQAILQNLIRERNLPCEALRQDFLEYKPAQPYDAIVIYGVIEHIPNYRRFCERAWDCLRPGGPLYMDASAVKEKYSISPFTQTYIWQAAHSFMALPDIIQEFLHHGFEIHDVTRETRDYELTMRGWAERFDAARDKIVAKWGEQTYRAFRVYLWGGCHAFHTDVLQAYHIVVRKGRDQGLRPGLLRRTRNFVQALP